MDGLTNLGVHRGWVVEMGAWGGHTHNFLTFLSARATRGSPASIL